MSDTPRTNNFDWSFHLLFAEAQKMERELNATQERIKRLEEAGDAMEKYCSDYYSCNKWYKAKEAKL